MLPTENCPICNNSDFKEFIKTKDFFLTQEDFSIYYCISCGFKFTYPVPSPENIGIYYKSSEYVSHSDTKKGLFYQLYHIVKNYTLKNKFNLINKYSKKGSILDYGCGTGDFLKAFKENNWNCFGVEPDTKTRQYATEKQNLNIISPEKIDVFEKKSLEVITLWHVLEHIPDLNEKLITFKSLLKDNGTLVIAVPNCDSYDAEYYEKYWAAYDVPRHLHHFNKKTLTLLLEKNGFEVIKIKNMLFDSFYVSMLSEKYKKTVLGFFKGSIIGLISNLKTFSEKRHASSFIFIIKQKNSF